VADFSAGTLLALAVILGLSALMSGLSGFGFSAIGALCLWLLPPKLGVPLLMTLSVANQMTSLRQLRADMKPLRQWWPEGAGPYLLGGVFGVPLGLGILQSLPAAQLMAVVGAVLVTYAAYSLLKPERVHVPASNGWRVPLLVGATGGVIGGFTAFPGAAVVVWSGLRCLPKIESRAIVQPYILGLQLLSLAILAVEHRETFNGSYWRLLLLMLPVVLPCTLLGVTLYRALSDVNFRRITFMLLGTSGLGLLAKAVGVVALLTTVIGAAVAH
jgi:uncharacterized membrane protein YfcA